MVPRQSNWRLRKRSTFASVRKEGDDREVKRTEQYLVKTMVKSATLRERVLGGMKRNHILYRNSPQMRPSRNIV